MSSINTNMSASIAQNALRRASKDLDTSMQRLSSGRRINSGSDDPAGMSMAKRIESDALTDRQAARRKRRDGIFDRGRRDRIGARCRASRRVSRAARTRRGNNMQMLTILHRKTVFEIFFIFMSLFPGTNSDNPHLKSPTCSVSDYYP